MPDVLQLTLGGGVIAVVLAIAFVVGRSGDAAPAGAAPSAMHTDTIARLDAERLRAWLALHPGATILDVRTPGEFAAGHLRGAVNLDVQSADFARRADSLTRGTAYVTYCRSGARSERAARQLAAMGHAPVANAGGFDALARAGFGVATGDR